MFELGQYDQDPVGPSHRECVAKGQGKHPNQNQPKTARAVGQNHSRRRFFGIWCPENSLIEAPHAQPFFCSLAANKQL